MCKGQLRLREFTSVRTGCAGKKRNVGLCIEAGAELKESGIVFQIVGCVENPFKQRLNITFLYLMGISLALTAVPSGAFYSHTVSTESFEASVSLNIT